MQHSCRSQSNHVKTESWYPLVKMKIFNMTTISCVDTYNLCHRYSSLWFLPSHIVICSVAGNAPCCLLPQDLCACCFLCLECSSPSPSFYCTGLNVVYCSLSKSQLEYHFCLYIITFPSCSTWSSNCDTFHLWPSFYLHLHLFPKAFKCSLPKLSSIFYF